MLLCNILFLSNFSCSNLSLLNLVEFNLYEHPAGPSILSWPSRKTERTPSLFNWWHQKDKPFEGDDFINNFINIMAGIARQPS